MDDELYIRTLVASEKKKWDLTHGRHMFTLKEYVSVHWNSDDWTSDRQSNAMILTNLCGKLQSKMEADGVIFQINPKTGTTISGEIYGGFRPQNCPEGAPHSAHKEGQAVDRYDPDGTIDDFITQFDSDNGDNSLLEEFGLYREHPDSTLGWSHWTTRAPNSGKRTFIP